MKKFLIIFTLILLASCGAESSLPEVKTEEVVTQVSESENFSQNLSESLKNAPKKLTETGEFRACMDTYTSACLQSTAMELSKKQNSTEFCDELASDAEKDSCRLGAILANAHKNADNLQCNSISDETLQLTCKTTLIREKAKKMQDISQCQSIKPLYKEQLEKGDSQETSCILEVLLQNPKLQKSDCNVISRSEERKMCEDMAGMVSQYGTTLQP